MSTPTPEPPSQTPQVPAGPTVQRLAQAVSLEAVRALMTARPVSLLTRGDMAGFVAVERVGMATEVVAATGDPIPADLWDLAVRCTTLGLASSLEQAAYPEQQLGAVGNLGRAEQLRTRFLAVRADLLRLAPSAGQTTEQGSWSGFVPMGYGRI